MHTDGWDIPGHLMAILDIPLKSECYTTIGRTLLWSSSFVCLCDTGWEWWAQPPLSLLLPPLKANLPPASREKDDEMLYF